MPVAQEKMKPPSLSKSLTMSVLALQTLSFLGMTRPSGGLVKVLSWMCTCVATSGDALDAGALEKDQLAKRLAVGAFILFRGANFKDFWFCKMDVLMLKPSL